jgi:hypothetical protein
MEASEEVLILQGPRSEGKSWVGVLRLLHQAAKLGGSLLPLRVGVIRDTWVNLQRTVITSINEMAGRGLAVQWLEDQREAILGQGLVHCLFFGLDRVAEVSKFQGLGLGALWLDDPAPAADVSGGIPVEVFAVGVTSLRQAGVPGWVQITQNPPDADHWTVTIRQVLREMAKRRPELRLRVRVFEIPPGERTTVEDRERNRAALEAAGRGDLVARLVEGRVGQIIQGEPCIPEYDDSANVAAEPLPILDGITIVRAWDFGLTPTLHWTQTTPRGHWHLLDCVQGTNMGVEQLIETIVKPWESEHLYAAGWQGLMRDIGDPAGHQREQSNSNNTAVLAVETLLRTSFEDGWIPWDGRKQALKAVMGRKLGRLPMVLVDPENTLTRRCLRGGWHYPKDGLGRITPTVAALKLASGLHDHVGHALTYGASVLYPLPEMIEKRRPRLAVPPATPRRLGWMGA